MADMTWYVCPVCGKWTSTVDRFPVCRFCKNEDVIVISKDEIGEIQNDIRKLPDAAKQKLLINKPNGVAGKDYMELGVMTTEYILQKYVFNDPRFSKAKYNERERVENAKYEYERAHRDEEIAALQEQVYGTPNPYRKVTCPTCGSTNTKKISAGAKAVSVGLFGIFSQKIKHQFHCNSCGYEW